MLTLTENADAVVTSIVAGQGADTAAGLRIATSAQPGTGGESRLAVTVVEAPEPADQVVEASGTKVFLESGAAEVLSDKVLDAAVDDNGAVSFTVLPQP